MKLLRVRFFIVFSFFFLSFHYIPAFCSALPKESIFGSSVNKISNRLIFPVVICSISYRHHNNYSLKIFDALLPLPPSPLSPPLLNSGDEWREWKMEKCDHWILRKQQKFAWNFSFTSYPGSSTPNGFEEDVIELRWGPSSLESIDMIYIRGRSRAGQWSVLFIGLRSSYSKCGRCYNTAFTLNLLSDR